MKIDFKALYTVIYALSKKRNLYFKQSWIIKKNDMVSIGLNNESWNNTLPVK